MPKKKDPASHEDTEPGFEVPKPAHRYEADAQMLVALPSDDEFADAVELLAAWVDEGWRVVHSIQHAGGAIVVLRPTQDD